MAKRSFITKVNSVMKHGVCKGLTAPEPKETIKKETFVSKTGIAGIETGKEK